MRKALMILAVLFCALPIAVRAQQTVTQPATKEEVEEVKDALEGVKSSFVEYQGYVDALRKIKITGYVQPQFRYTDLINTPYKIGDFSGGAFPANTKNLFQIRRGRLKFNYDNTLTQFVIQIDAIQTGFTTKDVYLSVIEPWTKSVGFQMGIFDRPFGYEISYSSSNRETPERSRLYQTLFPGERELGAKLFYSPQTGPLSMFRADVGLFNGSGPTANEFDSFKDIIGHLAYQIPLEQANAELDLGVSGYFGKVRNNTKDVYAWGTLPSGSAGFVKNSDTVNFGAGVPRSYLGFDAQLYYDIPTIGGVILRGEFITGTQPGTKSTTTSPNAQPTDPLYKRKFNGYYINLVKMLGDNDQLALKYDVYDPNSKASTGDFTTASGLSAADIKYTTFGFGLIHHWDANVKFVLYYEVIQNEKLDPANIPAANSLFPYTKDVRDNVLTFRVQYKF
jgi:hypothetical protein